MTDNQLGFIFYDNNKDDVISTKQVNNFFRRVVAKAGLSMRGQHALRHTFATRCIEAGVSAEVLRKWLGHKNIHITLDTYEIAMMINNVILTKIEKDKSNSFEKQYGFTCPLQTSESITLKDTFSH